MHSYEVIRAIVNSDFPTSKKLTAIAALTKDSQRFPGINAMACGPFGTHADMLNALQRIHQAV